MTVIRRWTIHRTFGLGFIDHEKPNAVVSGAAIDTPVDVVDAATYEGVVEDVADLVNALADAASRFRRDGDVFGAEQAKAILKRFGGQ